ncbi:putative flavanone 3-dioxygenase [Helianthus debilis subsp. tardiflorus]
MHRAVVNSEKERISIPTFYCPSPPDAVIGPAPQQVTNDEPAVYRQFTFEEYDRRYGKVGLASAWLRSMLLNVELLCR